MSGRPVSRLATCLAGCCLALLASTAAARRSASSELPEWAREATARAVPSTTADAVWLHEELVLHPLEEGGVRRSYRAAVKLLRPAALESFGFCAVGHRREDRLEKLLAWSVSPSGDVRAINPKRDVVEEPYISAGSVYEDWRISRADIPGAMVDGIVVWEYEVVRDFDTGAGDFPFGDPSRPTVFSRFEVALAPGWGLDTLRRRGDRLEVQETDAGVSIVARDLAPLEPDEYRPPARELLPLAWVRWWREDGSRGFEDWNAVGNWYRELTDPVMPDLGEATAVAERLRPDAAERWLGSVAAAFDFVARDVRYVSIQIGIGGFKPYPPSLVCKRRFGDCKDKSFLLRAIVEAWQTRAYPVLVRTAALGDVDPDVPTPAQFNHCIVAVAMPEGVDRELWSTREVEGLGRLLFLDATVRDGRAWDLRRDVQGTLGLLVHPGGGTLVKLPVQPPEAAVVTRRLRGRLAEDGTLVSGTLTESWSGTPATRIRVYYSGKSSAQRSSDVALDLQDRFRGASVESYEVQGLEDRDVPVTETTVFRGAGFGKRVADLLIVEPGSLGYGVVRTALPKPPREWPLTTGNPRREELEVVLQLPEGWAVEDVPQPFELEVPDLRARGAWTVEGNEVVYRRTAELLSMRVEPERYERFRDAVARLDEADRRAIVLIPR